MSAKKVAFGARPSTNTAAPAEADSWVKDRSTTDTPETMKRLTIDVSESLHRAIKSQCAQRGTKIADEVRELLLQKYGKTEIQK
jgi:predicted DNA binding CopG/RHH family protein